MGTGVSGFVYALAFDSAGIVYVGGQIYKAGGASVNSIAKWDGANWSHVGGGTNDIVFVLKVDASDNLYAGG